MVLQVGRDIQENTCTLEVHGLASRNGTPETVEFYLTLLKRQESVFGGLDTASSHQLASAALTGLNCVTDLLQCFCIHTVNLGA